MFIFFAVCLFRYRFHLKNETMRAWYWLLLTQPYFSKCNYWNNRMNSNWFYDREENNFITLILHNSLLLSLCFSLFLSYIMLITHRKQKIYYADCVFFQMVKKGNTKNVCIRMNKTYTTNEANAQRMHCISPQKYKSMHKCYNINK